MSERLRSDGDWFNDIPKEFIIKKEDGLELVTLKGLQHIARLAGWRGTELSQTQFGSHTLQSIVTVHFLDDTSWSAASDCSPNNTTDQFMKFPSAVSESRAEARALRKALGIMQLSFEELGTEANVINSGGIQPNSKISSVTIQAINAALDHRQMELLKALEDALGGKVANKVYSIEELTVSQGGALLSYINDLAVPKVGKKSRSARKKELEKELEDDS